MTTTHAPKHFTKTIAVLSGDGIGPEIMAEALRVLKAVGVKFGHTFTIKEGLIGGAAFARYKDHFPEETKNLCAGADAILFGSVGGPVHQQHLDQWKNCETNSLLALRKTFRFNANYRPARVYPQLASLSPLRPDIVAEGVDILVIRELLGDLYFGAHTRTITDGKRCAADVAEYDEGQIASIAHHAFRAARLRREKVTSIDKANVLETGKLWREIVKEVSHKYTDVTLEHMLVDNAAMQLMRNPSQFDVLLCPNMFGDILSDEAAMIPGSLGLMPSASLNEEGFGYYEPSGGSAPDIAGRGIANPIAQILSVALMLRFSFNLNEEAAVIERAIEKTLNSGHRTADLVSHGSPSIGTTALTDAILSFI